MTRLFTIQKILPLYSINTLYTLVVKLMLKFLEQENSHWTIWVENLVPRFFSSLPTQLKLQVSLLSMKTEICTLYNVCSVHRGGCSAHRGDIMSTSEGYHDACGGYHEYIGGYHEYIRGCSVHLGYHNACGGAS